MTRPRLKSSPPAKQLARRKPSQRPAAPSTRTPSPAARKPEQVAEAAVAREARTIPSAPGKVKLTLTVFLNREDAERLTTRAIREGRNLEALVAEILEAASK